MFSVAKRKQPDKYAASGYGPQYENDISKKIPASGYGDQYQNNVQQPKPQVTPAPQTQQPSQPSYNQFVNQYLQNRAGVTNQRVGDVENRFQEQQDLTKQLFDTRQKTLSNIGDIQKQSFGSYADQLRQGLDIRRGTGQRQIGDTKAQYDDFRYDNEKSRQERMKGLEGTLASLGTLESSAMGNIGAKINIGAERSDRQAQRAVTGRVADIEDSIRMAENEVEGMIEQEAGRYRQQAEALASQMDTNSIEYRQAVSSLAERANDRINQILDQFDAFSYQSMSELMKAQQPSSTVGQEQVDKEFAKTYAEYVSGGGSTDTAKQIRQLRQAESILENQEKAFGPLAGRAPMRDLLFKDAYNAEEMIKEVVQRNLRQILGAQFTEREGVMLMERAFNPKLPLSDNLYRLNNLITQIEDAAKQKDAAVRYYEQNGTLQGFPGRLYTSVSDFNPTRNYSQSNQQLVSQFGGR